MSEGIAKVGMGTYTYVTIMNTPTLNFTHCACMNEESCSGSLPMHGNLAPSHHMHHIPATHLHLDLLKLRQT